MKDAIKGEWRKHRGNRVGWSVGEEEAEEVVERARERGGGRARESSARGELD